MVAAVIKFTGAAEFLKCTRFKTHAVRTRSLPLLVASSSPPPPRPPLCPARPSPRGLRTTSACTWRPLRADRPSARRARGRLLVRPTRLKAASPCGSGVCPAPRPGPGHSTAGLGPTGQAGRPRSQPAAGRSPRSRLLAAGFPPGPRAADRKPDVSFTRRTRILVPGRHLVPLPPHDHPDIVKGVGGFHIRLLGPHTFGPLHPAP